MWWNCKTDPKAKKKKKKVVLFPEIGRLKFFLSLTHPHSRTCIRIYIFCSEQKKTLTQKQKAKETKGNRKTKEHKRRKGEIKCCCCF